MKRYFILLWLLLSGICLPAAAQRLELGARGGANLTDCSIAPVRIGETSFESGRLKPGFEAGIVLRLNIARWLHLQSGVNFIQNGYEFRVQGDLAGRIGVDARRLEIPLEAGLQLGVLRIFGGPVFRVAHSQRSGMPGVLKVKFNDSDVALTGGLGIRVRKFILDLRLTGYPGSSTRSTLLSGERTRTVKVRRHLIYGASVGFFF